MSDPIPFVPFRRNAALQRYHGEGLPHWRQEGCTYFVTFRTADSLPAELLRELREERSLWMEAQERSADEIELYSQVMDAKWNDALDRGSGSCPLRDRSLARFVEEALRYFAGDRLLLGDFVIMPNHVHVLMTPMSGFALEDLLGSIKGVSARKINRALGKSGAFWQEDSYDRLVGDGDELGRMQEYIRNNPVRAGLKPETLILGTANYLAM